MVFFHRIRIVPVVCYVVQGFTSFSLSLRVRKVGTRYGTPSVPKNGLTARFLVGVRKVGSNFAFPIGKKLFSSSPARKNNFIYIDVFFTSVPSVPSVDSVFMRVCGIFCFRTPFRTLPYPPLQQIIVQNLVAIVHDKPDTLSFYAADLDRLCRSLSVRTHLNKVL